MIVISGALVIVALGLLIAGLVVSGGLALVYASIGVSVLSALFLLFGVRQRRPVTATEGAPVAAPSAASLALARSVGSMRGRAEPAAAGEPTEPAPSAAPAAAMAEDPAVAAADPEVRIVPPVTTRTAAAAPAAPAAPAAASTGAAPVAAGEVLVVPGRPRYHVPGCRYLAGRETEARDAAQARGEGFQPCASCRPDEVLAAASTPAPAAPGRPARRAPRPAPATEVGAAVAAVDPGPSMRKAGSPRAGRKQVATPIADEQPAPRRRAAGRPAATPAAALAATATPAATTPRRTETVVVIPDRGRYHRPDCRFVRDAPNAQERSKAAARRAGYEACGVCKP